MKMIACTRCKKPVLYCECPDIDERLNKIIDMGGSEAGLATYMRLARTVTQSLGVSKKRLAEIYIGQNPDDQNAADLYMKEHTLEGQLQTLRGQWQNFKNEIKQAALKSINEIKQIWRDR